MKKIVGKLLASSPKSRQRIKALYAWMCWNFPVKRPRARIHPDVRRIDIPETKEFFFGYYDKSPWSDDGKQILYHRISDDPKRLELIGREWESGESRCLGTTSTWNLQQGAMLQWRPAHPGEVMYNSLSADGNLITEIRNASDGGLLGTLPMPIQTVRKDGNRAISLNYRRLAVLRPDYGYTCEAKNFSPDMSDSEDGLFSVDLETGETALILSIEKLKNMTDSGRFGNARHKVNHAMYAPKGRRLVFLYRCLHDKGKKDRLYAVNDDGTDLELILDDGRPDGLVSHYSWIDDAKLLVYARTEDASKGCGYFMVDTITKEKTPVAENTLWKYGDGHPTMLHRGDYFITDTYPDLERRQYLFLYDGKKDRVAEIARLYSPFCAISGNRCDFHPRLSPDHRYVSIDSTENGRRAMSIYHLDNLLDRMEGET